MNFDELNKIIKRAYDSEYKDFNSFLVEDNNLCNKVLQATAEHKLSTFEIAKVAGMIPNLEEFGVEEVNGAGYKSLMRSIEILIKVYKKNRKQVDDVIFLLQWYQRKCKSKYGQAS